MEVRLKYIADWILGSRMFFLFNLIDRLDEVSNVYASLFYF